VFQVSRSYISDEIVGSHSRYPLYLKGSERERFEVGISQLSRVIIQILRKRGAPANEEAGLLENLLTLYKRELPVA